MSNIKTDVEGLAGALQSIMDEYADDVGYKIDLVTEELAKKCVKQLKARARATFKRHDGKYINGWMATQTQKGFKRGNSQYTVHHRYPGFPHLLENDHAFPSHPNSPYRGRKHIQPVHDAIVKEYEQKVKEGIENA